MTILAGGFAELGRRVDIVLVKAEGPYLSRVPVGVEVVDLNQSRTYLALPSLISYLVRRRPRSVLSTLTHANTIAWMARALAFVSFRLVVREANTYSKAHDRGSWRKRKLMPALMRLCYSRVDAVVAVSSGVKDDLVEQGVPEGNICVIHNPAATPDMAEQAAEPVDHPFFGKRTHKVILSVGRLTAQKDHSTLIEAFRVVRTHVNAKLVILGEGALRDALKEQVALSGLSEDVSMPGFVDNPFAFMARADLFVLSSRWEGLPNTLIQAMACGTPVVSTDCPSGPAEILEGGKWGRLVTVGDAQAMAGAMIAALTDTAPPGVAKRAADFGVEQAVTRYLQLLEVT